MTLSSLFTDDVGPLPLLAVAGAGFLIWYVRYLGENDPGWKGFVANILTVIGVGAYLVVLAVVVGAFLAVMLFMVPLFALGGASGVDDRRARRGYYRDRYDNDYY
jgi:ABC-type transport system involved in cytochrome bd biosynthesis fused ATPase/permease subunit